MKCIVDAIVKEVTPQINIYELDDLDFNTILMKTSLLFKDLFSEVMNSILTKIDDFILHSQHRANYEPRRIIERTLYTLNGPVPIRRRYYKHVQSKDHKFLLDELLNINSNMRVSEDITQLCAGLNGMGLSYRDIANVLELMLGEQALSHQGVRDHTMAIAEKLQAIDKAKELDTINTLNRKKVPILFIEADGFWIHEQKKRTKRKKKNKDRFEAYTVVVHEGWEHRHKKDYQLINSQFFTAVKSEDKEQIWDTVRESLYWTYEDLDNTIIIINGDGAPWIRAGVGYFGKAIYQYDRFHVARDLRLCLKKFPELAKKAQKALETDEVWELHPILAEALSKVSIDDTKLKEQLVQMISRIESNQEFIVDYRKRIDKTINNFIFLRGMGAAESSVKRFKKRMKGVGKAWSINGANAMIIILAKYFSGTFGHYLNAKKPELIEQKHENPPLSAAQSPTTIKGKKLGNGVVRGGIVQLRRCYTQIGNMLQRMSSC